MTISRTVLIIDYFFPPLAGPGVHRTLGFLRYLRHFGWDPVVLTVRSGDSSFYDPSLLSQVPVGARVHRAGSIEPVQLVKGLLSWWADSSWDGHPEAIGTGRPVWRGTQWLHIPIRWLLFPDRRIGWLPFAYSYGRRILRETPIDVIYSTMTSPTNHLVAYFLWRATGKPWIVDFQDPWTQKEQFPSRIHGAIARRLEERILEVSDHITVTTEHHRQMLLAGFKTVAESKVTVIPIGYDPDIFADLEPDVEQGFVITHFGAFYATRSPEPFLRAAAQCLASRPELARDLRIRFLGHFDARMLDLTCRLRQELGLTRIVSLEGTLPYRRALRILLGSSLLLFVADKGVWGRVMSSAKLGEYLGARRPILALVPDGAIGSTIREINAGFTVDPEDISGIRSVLLRAYDLWRLGRLTFSGDSRMLKNLTWRQLTGSLVSILDSVTSKHRVGQI